LALIQPAPELGAKSWTMFGQRILLGVFRDEGRPANVQTPRQCQWLRTGDKLFIGTDRPHRLAVGDEVKLYAVNLSMIETTVSRIFNDTEFECPIPNIGDLYGIFGSFQPLKPFDFAEENIVFRFLPSFKLVTIEQVNQMFADCQRVVSSALVYLNSPLTNERIKFAHKLAQAPLPVKNSNGSSQGGELNRQQFNSLGQPLQAFYDARGLPVKRNKLVHSKFQTDLLIDNPPLIAEEHSFNPTANSRIYAYDFYGFDINDPSRGPYNRSDIIAYSADSPDGLVRLLDQRGVPIYQGPIYDEFSNFVLGATADNTLYGRAPIMPIEVDQFNQPYAKPQRFEFKDVI
jgi:hypothetical protein